MTLHVHVRDTTCTFIYVCACACGQFVPAVCNLMHACFFSINVFRNPCVFVYTCTHVYSHVHMGTHVTMLCLCFYYYIYFDCTSMFLLSRHHTHFQTNNPVDDIQLVKEISLITRYPWSTTTWFILPFVLNRYVLT